MKIFKLFKNSIVKQIGYYFTINVLQKTIPFLILPICSRLFTKDEMGYYLLYQTLMQIILPIMTLGVDTSVILEFHRLKKERYATFIFMSLLVALFFTVIAFIIYGVFHSSIADAIQFSDKWLFVTLLTIFPTLIYAIYLNLQRFQEKIKHYGVISILVSVLVNGGGLVLAFMTSLKWESFVISNFIGYFFVSVYCIYQLFKQGYINLKWEFKWVRDILKVGIPAALNSIGSWLGNSINRLLLNILIGTAATADYGIGATFGMIMTLIQDSINLAYVPIVFKNLNDGSQNSFNLLNKLSLLLYFAIIACGVILSLVGYYGVSLLFGTEYADTKDCIIPLVAVGCVNGLYKVHNAYISYSKRTDIIMWITVSSGVVNVLLAYLMIPQSGILGAAYSALIAQCIAYIMCMYYANKSYDMHFWEFIKTRLVNRNAKMI